jgi:hypothetical protein
MLLNFQPTTTTVEAILLIERGGEDLLKKRLSQSIVMG